MGDSLIQILLPPIAIVCCIFSVRATGRIINPILIICAAFFLPLWFATFRLSGLQNSSWAYETYIALWLVIATWLVAPTIMLLIGGRQKRPVDIRKNLDGHFFLLLYRSFAIVICLIYLISNYIQAGTVLPILVPEIAYKLHTEFPPILRLFARCIPSVVGLAYIAFAMHRRWVDLMILALALVVPLTRLSRIDVALSLVVLLLAFTAMPAFKLTTKRLIILAIFGLAVVVGSVELGNQRTNRFGQYEVKYERAIKWLPATSGIAGVYSVLYGYFPLSFENFDEFVRHSKLGTSNGLLSFDWFFSGVIKLNRLGGDLTTQTEFSTFSPISTAANVPTALLPFYADFGLLGMIFPTSLYISIWIFLFYRGVRSIAWLLAYCVYTAAFSLSAFQALVAAPIIFHQIVLTAVICICAAWLQTAYRRRRNRRHQPFLAASR
jgi:hypothetical protein